MSKKTCIKFSFNPLKCHLMRVFPTSHKALSAYNAFEQQRTNEREANSNFIDCIAQPLLSTSGRKKKLETLLKGFSFHKFSNIHGTASTSRWIIEHNEAQNCVQRVFFVILSTFFTDEQAFIKNLFWSSSLHFFVLMRTSPRCSLVENCMKKKKWSMKKNQIVFEHKKRHLKLVW